MIEYDANVAISSFASNLEYARSEFEEEDEDWDEEDEDDFEFELKEGDERCEWEDYA